MRHLLLALLALAVLAVPMSRILAQEAEDEGCGCGEMNETEKLEKEVAELKELVEELSAEVARLKARVAALEGAAAEASAPPPPTRELSPASPTEVAKPKEVTGDHAVYVLDNKDLETKLIDYIVKQYGPMLEGLGEAEKNAQLEQMKAQAKMQAAAIQGTLMLDKDGRCKAVMSAMGQEEILIGTWKAGEGSVTLTITHEGGAELPQPRVIVAKDDGKKLSMKPKPEMPFDIVMVKK